MQASHPCLSSPLAATPLAPEGSDLVLVEWEDEGGGSAAPQYLAPPHVHYADDEAFYVLEGSLAFLLDGEHIQARAGDAVMIPKGTVHTWWNPEPATCRYLIVMPRRIHDLIARLHAPDESRSPAEIFLAFESELRD